MKSFCARGLVVALGLMGVAEPIMAQGPFGSDSLLPLPSVGQTNDVVTRTAYGYNNQEEISPSDMPGTQSNLNNNSSKQAPGGLSQSFAPPAAPVELSPDYQGAMKQAWDAPAGCSDGSCGDVGNFRGTNRFFAYGGGLVMGRANQCNTGVTQNASNYETVLHTGQADQQYAGGFETQLGYVFNGGCNAISIGYWGLFPSDEMYRIDAMDYAGGLRPVMGSNLNLVDYDDGMTTRSVYDWMSTTSGYHEIERTYNYNNVEINFLGNAMAWNAIPPCGPGGYGCLSGCNNGCCTPKFQWGWLAGFRYFGLQEAFSLYTDYDDEYFDSNDPDQMCYHIKTNNTLLGFQMGGQGSWNVTKCWSINGGGRFGVYNNHITSTQEIYGQNGYAQIASGTYAGTDYDFMSSRDALAGVGQIDLGSTYNWGCHWSFTGGYRVVGISGVATSTSQIANNFADPRYVQQICANDTVILHGAYLGATFRW